MRVFKGQYSENEILTGDASSLYNATRSSRKKGCKVVYCLLFFSRAARFQKEKTATKQKER